MMQFAHPGVLWLFLIYLPLIAWYVWKRRTANPSLGISTVAPFGKLGRPMRAYALHAMFALRLLAIGCLIIVLARPQTRDAWRTSKTEGTDMVIALDISSSMLARDFKPDRLEAAKKLAAKFINGRENDNMGLVVFAGEAFTGVPMTTDRAALTRRHGHRRRSGNSNQPHKRGESEVEEHNSAHRRIEQHGNRGPADCS